MDGFSVIVASKDWHPHETVHFKKWPVHCVHNSRGAEFHPGIRSERIQQVFLKGTSNKDDGYSAYEATNLDLEKYLRERGVDELYVTGLATDYCVLASALDSVRKGFKTYVVDDAVAAVNLKPSDGERAIREMEIAGVSVISSKDVRNPKA